MNALASEDTSPSRPRRRLERALPWMIFLIVSLVHLEGRVATSFDSGWSVYVSLSLLQEGNLDLDEYREIIEPSDYRVIEVDGHLQSYYPVATSIVAAPAVWAAKVLTKRLLNIRLDRYLRKNSPAGVERFASSLIVALSAVLIFRLARLVLGLGGASFVTFVFAFCSSAWSSVSRGLWQHGPSILFLTAALYFLVRGAKEERLIPYAGLFLGLAYTVRPTNVLSVLALTAFVALCHRASLARFIGWGALVAVVMAVVNLTNYGALLPPYFQPRGDQFSVAATLSGALGTLVSPGRGLFVYSPVFLFSLVGAWLRFRQGRWRALDTAVAGIAIGHWLLISSWFNWWGGTVYGPRLFADMIPYLIYFLVPFVEAFASWSRGPRLAVTVPLLATVLLSVAMHRTGSRCWSVWDWNVSPANVDQHPERLWDWSDPPFLRRESALHKTCS